MASQAKAAKDLPLSQLVSLVLRAFVLAYGKSIDLAYSELTEGNVIDGEDCWLDPSGLPLQMTESVDEIVSCVDFALDWLDHFEGDNLCGVFWLMRRSVGGTALTSTGDPTGMLGTQSELIAAGDLKLSAFLAGAWRRSRI